MGFGEGFFFLPARVIAGRFDTVLDMPRTGHGSRLLGGMIGAVAVGVNRPSVIGGQG